MTRRVRFDRRVHPPVHNLAVDLQEGRIDCRNFLRNTTLFGNQHSSRKLNEAGTEPDVDKRRTRMAAVHKTLRDDPLMSRPLWVPSLTAAGNKANNHKLQPAFCRQFHKAWVDA